MFGHPFGRGSPFDQLFNDPFFSSPLTSVFANDPFFQQAGGHARQQHPAQAHTRQHTGHPPRHQVQIEELDVAGDEGQEGLEGGPPRTHASSPSEPYIEEPDDDPTHRSSQRPRHNSPQRAAPPQPHPSARQAAQRHAAAPQSMFGGLFGGGLFGGAGLSDLAGGLMAQGSGSSSFSYSTTTFTSSGPGGVHYSASTSTRAGPSGVRETHSTVQDGRTGRQAMRIARGIGDKEHVISRARDASGREIADEVLRGIEQDDAHRFDQEWMQQADRFLPPAPGFGPQRVGPGTGRGAAGHRLQQALPAPPLPAQGFSDTRSRTPATGGWQQSGSRGWNV